MTISVSYPDSVYYPQANTTVNVTITPPYREDRLTFIYTRASKGVPETDENSYIGYCYYATDDKCLRLFNGSTWETHWVAPYDIEKRVFYHIENGGFYAIDDSYTMNAIRVGSGTTFCLKLESLASEPRSPGTFDLYWDGTQLRWWAGAGWVNTGMVFSLSDNCLYAYDGTLYSISTYDFSFTPFYYIAIAYMQDMPYSWGTNIGGDLWEWIDGEQTTVSYPISLEGHSSFSYYMMVRYLTEGQSNARIITDSYETDGTGNTEYIALTTIQGQRGAINPAITITETVPDYPLPTDTLALNCTVTPTDSAPASVLRPYTPSQTGYEARSGISWSIRKTAGATTWSQTLDAAVAAGRAVKGTAYSLTNSSVVEILLTEAGTYTITASGEYRNAYGQVQSFSQSITHRVYSPSKPTLELVSITPAEYASGDSDPLNGLPPFTAIWKDTTAESDPYQIPQAGITIDFGDAESGTRNRAYIANTGTTLITIPNQEHSYNGYGPYVAQLTITDKRGNVTNGTMGFTPSPAPRIIKAPTLTPLEGDQPLLIQGQAFVAGNPLPEVLWEYELEGGDPDYYAGEKEGDWMEISLLAGGQYTVRCTTSNEGTIIGRSEFTVAVEAAEIHADTPVEMNDFDIWVFDKSTGERAALLHPVASAYTDRFNHASYCEFKVPADCGCLDLLRPGGEIAFGYKGIARYCRVEEFSESEDGTEVSITALDAVAAALSARTATVATRSTNGNGYDIQTCSAEALLRYFAIANTSGEREIPRFILIGENQDRGGKVVYSARYEEVLDIIEDICADSNLGWEGALHGENPVRFGMKIREGAERDVVFADTPERRTAKVEAYREYASPNVAITGGDGSGGTRSYAEYGETASTDLDRREVFVDAGDSASESEMRRMGELELLRQKEQSIRIYPGEEYALGVDYDTGDYVTVVTKSGVTLQHMQIIQVTRSKDNDGVVTVLECGTDLRGITRLMREAKLANTYARK